jgi:hypothetical protein
MLPAVATPPFWVVESQPLFPSSWMHPLPVGLLLAPLAPPVDE